MRTILLIMIGLSSFLSADFTKSGDVVYDDVTGLEWQDNNETNSIKRRWQDAIDYCEALSLDAHDDWRLPNINELKTLIDRSKRAPAIKGDAFEYVRYETFMKHYWSSTSVVGFVYRAWTVHFSEGRVDTYLRKEGLLYVRCVRDRQ